MIDITAIAMTNEASASGGTASKTDFSFSPYPGVNGSNTADATISFGDFLDMINPLQHIPVLSSLYRAATGDTISPISRVAGDTLYGGIMGLASAGLSALGAIGDEVITAGNGGQSVSSTVMAALFGSPDPTNKADEIQVADASSPSLLTPSSFPLPSSPPAQAGVLQTIASQSPILAIPDFFESGIQSASASPVPPIVPVETMAVGSAGQGGGIPLDRSKYAAAEGVDSGMLQRAQENQTLALALAGGAQALQAQRHLQNSRFAAAVSAPTTALQPAASGLDSGLQAMKGLSQYRSAAQSVPVLGSSLDVTN